MLWFLIQVIYIFFNAKKVKKVSNSNYFLEKDKVIVNGKNKSLIIDLKLGEIYRINESARNIISLGEKGLTVKDTIEHLESDLDFSEIITFVDDLENNGFIQRSIGQKKPVQYEKPPPKLDLLWIEVTPSCNLRCVHCYASADEFQNALELPKDVIFRVIDDAADEGCRKIQFTGGEPTLRADLRELINHADSKGIRNIEVFTNGTLLSEEMIRNFSDMGVSVALSLYSHKKEVHEGITQSQGSYRKSFDSLRMLLEHGVPVRCGIIAMKQNEAEIEDTKEYLTGQGDIKTSVDPIRPAGRGIDTTFWPTKPELFKFRMEPDFYFDEETFRKNLYWNPCWYGKAAVSSSGDVLPCVFSRDQIVGNVLHERLSDILRGEKMLNLWGLNKDKIETCRDCEYRYVCQDCRPWAKGFSGNLNSKSPRCAYDPLKGEWDSPLLASICKSF
jgi:radical SAM protein with 4Fe4S-binding SPASM domain